MKKILPKDKLVIGLTGMPGSGKSLVLKYLKKLGWRVISSDEIAHQLLERKSVRQQVLKKFPFSQKATGEIDRQRLGEIIFQHPNKRKILQDILHPLIISRIKQEIVRFRKQPFGKNLAIEVPLLFEVGLEKLFDQVVMVDTSKRRAFQRLKKTRNWKRNYFNQVWNSQLSPTIKRKKSDYVLKNYTSRPEQLFSGIKSLIRKHFCHLLTKTSKNATLTTRKTEVFRIIKNQIKKK